MCQYPALFDIHYEKLPSQEASKHELLRVLSLGERLRIIPKWMTAEYYVRDLGVTVEFFMPQMPVAFSSLLIGANFFVHIYSFPFQSCFNFLGQEKLQPTTTGPTIRLP